MKKSFFLQLSFVLILCTGFTCQKKYPPPLAETTSGGDASSEDSNSTSEIMDSSNVETEKPVDKTGQ